MGADSSKRLEQQVRHSDPESDENYIGLDNFGNTCYFNSVVQALYWCKPFRASLLQYCQDHPPPIDLSSPPRRIGGEEVSLLYCLGDLFYQLQTHKRRTGHLAPKRMVHRMRGQSEVFASLQQQDAHEFLVYLLNDLTDTIRGQLKAQKNAAVSCRVDDSPLPGQLGKAPSLSSDPSNSTNHMDMLLSNGEAHTPTTPSITPFPPPPKKPKDDEANTFVQELFEGQLAAETRCLTCESITSREEVFMGLCVDVMQNVSLLSALRDFSRGEMMDRDNKFHCDVCRSLQEARRSLRIKKAPPVLAIQLKRFKFMEDVGRHCKLSYRIPFPLDIRLPIEGPQGDDLYHLFAVVIHKGVGPNLGHYVCMAKTGGQWMLFDDDHVSIVSEREVAQGYGVPMPTESSTSTGYLLFYSAQPFAQLDDPSTDL
eukprot:Sspe_Gene.82887::Locus_54346_Transcript_6_7_Confidence_0.143_Length_2854::g.82887::m.82887/K11842/USP12_46; ubiquitin carboxyl-terminal hydrolase 12/46